MLNIFCVPKLTLDSKEFSDLKATLQNFAAGRGFEGAEDVLIVENEIYTLSIETDRKPILQCEDPNHTSYLRLEYKKYELDSTHVIVIPSHVNVFYWLTGDSAKA